MDHKCYKCGADVDEGMAFCPECRAPQIRVNVSNEPATPPLPPGTPGQLQPPSQPVPLERDMHWRDALPAALAAAVLLLMMIFPLLALVAGGAFAVAVYARRRPQAHLTAGMGARIGAVTGIFAFLCVLITMIIAGGAAVRSVVQQAIRNAAVQGNPAAKQMLDQLDSPQVLGTFMVAMIIALFILIVGLATLGGVIGARLMRRKS